MKEVFKLAKAKLPLKIYKTVGALFFGLNCFISWPSGAGPQLRPGSLQTPQSGAPNPLTAPLQRCRCPAQMKERCIAGGHLRLYHARIPLSLTKTCNVSPGCASGPVGPANGATASGHKCGCQIWLILVEQVSKNHNFGNTFHRKEMNCAHT